MDGGWRTARDCRGGPKQTGQSCGRGGGQNMGRETLYQDQPRGSIAGRTRPAGTTVVRKWDEEKHRLHHSTSSSALPHPPTHCSSILCDDESLQDTI